MTHRKQMGAAMIVAIEVLFLIAGIAAIMVQSATTENLGTDSLVLDTQANYLAESGAEYAIKQITRALANRETLPQPFLAGWSADASVMRGFVPGYEPGDPAKPSIVWKVFQLEASERIVNDADDIDHAYMQYAVTARGIMPDPREPGRYFEAYINKIVDTDKIPLFQYLAFYSKYDLEIQPGPSATLTGRVHSNRDIYIGTQPGSNLTMVTNYLRSSGALRRNRKDNPSDYMAGMVRIKKRDKPDASPVNDTNFPLIGARGQVTTPYYSVGVPTAAAPNGYDSSFAGYDGNADGDVLDASDLPSFVEGSKSRWAGTVQTGADGVSEIAAPDLSNTAAFTLPSPGQTPTHAFNTTTKKWEPSASATHVPGYYQKTAGLIVASNGSRITMTDSAGVLLHEVDNSGAIITSKLVDSASGSPINPVAEKNLFDRREYNASQDSATAGKVNVIDIDMAKLNKSKRTDTGNLVFPTTATDTNGLLVYAYRTDASVISPRGVRLVNGSELNNKMTLVSENPVYIKGNFNTVNKKGVAVMSDATSLLSNEWNDSKTKDTGLPNPGTDLEINAAIVTGAYETLPGVYNGGFENFPRFHENWSIGRTVKIRGSFVSLFESAFAKGKWVYGGNYYTAPNRNWDFDKDLLKKDFLPPGFPVSVSARRTVWWKNRDTNWWPLN